MVDDILFEGRPLSSLPGENAAAATTADEAAVNYARSVIDHYERIGAPADAAATRRRLAAEARKKRIHKRGLLPDKMGELNRLLQADWADESRGPTASGGDGKGGTLATMYTDLKKFGCMVTKRWIHALLDMNARVPFDIVLLRPFMTYSMSSAILMKSGWETGATFVGHSDFILGDDVVSKLHYGPSDDVARHISQRPRRSFLCGVQIFRQFYIL